MSKKTIEDLITKANSQKLFISEDGKLHPVNCTNFSDITVPEIENFCTFKLDTFITKINKFMGKNPYVIIPETIVQIVFNTYMGYSLSIEDSDANVIKKIFENIEFTKEILCYNTSYKLSQILISAATSTATISFKCSKQLPHVPYLEVCISNTNTFYYPVSFIDICIFISNAIKKYKYEKKDISILKHAIEDATGIKYVHCIDGNYFIKLINANYYFNRKIKSDLEMASIFYDCFCIIDRYGDVIIKEEISLDELYKDIEVALRKIEITSKYSILKYILYQKTGLKKCYTNNVCFRKWAEICQGYLEKIKKPDTSIGIRNNKVMIQISKDEFVDAKITENSIYGIIDEFFNNTRAMNVEFSCFKNIIAKTLIILSDCKKTFKSDPEDELYMSICSYILNKRHARLQKHN